MFNMLDVLLVLAFLSTIAVTVLTQQPFGPEGPVGVWLLLLIPCLFVAILVFAMVAKGAMNFVPGGGLIQFVIAFGILVTFSTFTFGLLSGHDSLAQGLIIAVPFLILAGLAAAVHHTDFPDTRLVYWVAAILLSGAALTGWGLTGTGLFFYIKKDMEQAALRVQEAKEQETEREQWEIAEYAKLDDSAPLHVLLPFTWARNDQILQQACERVSRFPELDDKLVELLNLDSEVAISYIAKVYENPPAKLAPAWGRMLERQLGKWDSLQYDEHAGTWEYNLRPYFEGAQKIQLAGGSLHNELAPWHQHLQKCKGLGNLAAFVEDLLQTNSKS